jgi:hypothetical protein
LKDMYRYAVLDTSKEQRLLNAQFLHNEYVWVYGMAVEYCDSCCFVFVVSVLWRSHSFFRKPHPFIS